MKLWRNLSIIWKLNILIVTISAAVLMLANGLQKTLVETGSPDNVVVIRRAAQSEVQSGVERAGFRGDNVLLVMNWLDPGMEVMTKPFVIANLANKIRDMIER